MDDTTDINPATGLPMVGGLGGFDSGGNLFGHRSSNLFGHRSSRRSRRSYSTYGSFSLDDAKEHGFLKFISVSSIIIALIAIFS